jgi:hypothetical protein
MNGMKQVFNYKLYIEEFLKEHKLKVFNVINYDIKLLQKIHLIPRKYNIVYNIVQYFYMAEESQTNKKVDGKMKLDKIKSTSDLIQKLTALKN